VLEEWRKAGWSTNSRRNRREFFPALTERRASPIKAISITMDFRDDKV